MRYIHRSLEPELKKAIKTFPALLLTGPRRAGKTTLLKTLFPKAAYFLLEDPDIIGRINEDPRSFVEEIKPPVIIDEIQNVPELFNYLRTRIDAVPHRTGQWLLTGSQDAPLMREVSESMAGRVAIFNLLPLSSEETNKVSIIKGGFPEVLDHPQTASVWFRSYIQTYLERDVRALTAIKNLATFRRFLALLASRAGSMLNKTDLAAPLGVSIPTITDWLAILEITGQIILVPPFYENFGKRLIKSPKIYFVDSGLIAYLLGIETKRALQTSPFLGAIFEGFVATEITKHQINHGKRRELYYFRDQQGLEIDFIVPKGNANLTLIEAKATRTVKPVMADPLRKLMKAISRYTTESIIVHRNPPHKTTETYQTVSPGIKAIPVVDIGHYC